MQLIVYVYTYMHTYIYMYVSMYIPYTSHVCTEISYVYVILFPFSGFGKKLSVGGWPNKSYQVFKAVFCARNGLFGES